MPLTVKPTIIKQSVYLRIPKDIAELVEINKRTKFSLNISTDRKKSTLEYRIK